MCAVFPVVIDIQAALHAGTVCSGRYRRAVCQEQDVIRCVSVAVDAGIRDIAVRIRRTVQYILSVLPGTVISVVVALGFQTVVCSDLFATVIKQRELDALCYVVDRFDCTQRVACRSQYRSFHFKPVIRISFNNIFVCINIVRNALCIGNGLFTLHALSAQQCCVIHGACVAGGIVHMLRKFADEKLFPAFVGVNVLRVFC